MAWGVQVEPEQPTPIPPETAAPQQTEAQQLITASGSLGVLTVGRKEIPIAGNVDEATLDALSRAYSGLLFDDLCDTCQNSCEITEILRRLYEAAEQAEPRQKFLLICLQYDALSQPLPNPIWWISGDSELAGDFAERFICHLKKLSDAMEVTEP